jgi:PIN domain nuclease of toxin-antitoxin system
LPKSLRRELDGGKAELWLSPISVWEAHMALEGKSVKTSLRPQEWIQKALEATPVQSAPLTVEVALESRRLGLSHPDPVDRFIAATAVVYELTLATADERLLIGKGYRVFAID